MTTVGVRELRQRASDLLRRVATGETIEITDHGHPVAVLAPLPDAGARERLRSAGDLVAGKLGLDTLPAPLPLGPAQEPPSRALERLRRDER